MLLRLIIYRVVSSFYCGVYMGSMEKRENTEAESLITCPRLQQWGGQCWEVMVGRLTPEPVFLATTLDLAPLWPHRFS